MSNKMARNVTLVYGIAFFQSFLVIVPVIVPFFASKGLSLAEVFYLQVTYAAAIVLLEAPSGYLADLFGRRTILIAGGLAHGLGYFCLNFADGFLGLVVFEIFAGIGASLLSGADVAILYDSQLALQEQGKENELTHESDQSRGIAQLGFYRSGAEGLGALLGGLLALKSFDLMVLMQSVSAWMCLIFALFLKEPSLNRQVESDQAKQNTESRLRVSQVIKHMIYGDPVLKWLVITIPIYNLATFHAAWLIQPYWEAQGISLALFGVLWFAQSLTVAISSKLGFLLERKLGAVMALLVIAALPILGHFGMATFQGWLGIGLGLLLFTSRGLCQVILVNALNKRVPSGFRATANSLTSFLFRLGFIVSGPIVGFSAEALGLNATLMLLGMAAIVMAATVMRPLITVVKQQLRNERNALQQKQQANEASIGQESDPCHESC